MQRRAAKSTIHKVGNWQKYLLDQYCHPDCTDDLRQLWVLTTGTLVRPRVDMRRLVRALQNLMTRHDTLRIRFELIKGQWMAVVHPPEKPVIRSVDLGDMDDETYRAKIKEIANAPLPLVGDALAELIVANCGHRGDVIIARIHHAITDGYGLVVLTEELIKMLIGMPILSKAVSHAEYIAKFDNPPPSHASEFDAYWKEMHRGFPVAPNVGRKAKGMEPLVYSFGAIESRFLKVSLGGEEAKLLRSRADRLNAGSFVLFYTGFLEALCQQYDLEQLMFETPVARTDKALNTYVGDHTLDPVIRHVALGSNGLEQSVATQKENMYLALSHLPHDAARRGTKWENEIIAAGGYPRQFSVYQRHLLSRQSRSIFGEGFGKEHGVEQKVGPYWVSSVNVSQFDRWLHELQFEFDDNNSGINFSMNYDGLGFHDEEIVDLANRLCDLLDIQSARFTHVPPG